MHTHTLTHMHKFEQKCSPANKHLQKKTHGPLSTATSYIGLIKVMHASCTQQHVHQFVARVLLRVLYLATSVGKPKHRYCRWPSGKQTRLAGKEQMAFKLKNHLSRGKLHEFSTWKRVCMMLQIYFFNSYQFGLSKCKINADKQSKTSKQTKAYKLNLEYPLLVP